ncbi:MAG: methyltransferase domain-containing protein [Actinomycetota bacterium]
MASHQDRASSFGQVAETYDRYRPAIPPEVALWFGAKDALTVLDVAAGTGLSTRTFEALGCNVTAIDPDQEMLEVLKRRSPDITCINGVAESLDVPEATIDLEIMCSAWHWVHVPTATKEAARVLKDGGTLGICWNGFDQRVDWVAGYAELRDSTSVTDDLGDRLGHSPQSIVLPDDAPFSAPEICTIDWVWRRSLDELALQLTTYSGIIVGGPERSESVQRIARAMLADRVEDDGLITIPMAARCWKATRLPRA